MSAPQSTGGSPSLNPEWTLWPEVSPVSPSRSRAAGSRRTIPAGSGPSLPASFATYDPDTRSWRTSQVCLGGELETFSETWPRSGMTRNGTAYRRLPSVPRTSVTDGSAWPTPRATDGSHGGRVTPRESREGGNLVEAVSARTMWPTPTVSGNHNRREYPTSAGDGLETAVKRWPTPMARDHRTGQAHRGGDPARHFGWNLNDWAAADPGQGHASTGIGQLNPTWVEVLMGFPLGWTDLDD